MSFDFCIARKDGSKKDIIIKAVSRKSPLIFSLVVISSFAYLYKDVILNLVKVWIEDGNYSHGFFVPILVGYIVWSKRKELLATPAQPFWPAILLVLLSGLLLIAGQLSIHGFSRNFSLILMISSLTLLILGRAWSRKLLFPLAFLIFMIPLPEFFTRKVTTPLQLFSSYISVNLLSLMNYTVFREGNIIQLPGITLSVAEACSGLRSILALTFLAVTVAYFVLKSNRKRLFLILCAVPIAIVLNWVRITGTVLLANHWGVEVAQSFFHAFSGLLIFLAASMLIGFIMLFLRSKEEQTTPSQTSDVATAPPGSPVRLSALIVSSGLLVILALYANFLFSLKPGPPVDLLALPLKIGPYVGKDLHIDSGITEFSDVTQDRSISFRNPDKPRVDLYIGYYRTGKELKGFFHGPDVCLPGFGWKIIKKEQLALNLSGYKDEQVEVLKYVSTKMGVTQVMITWFQAGRLVGTGTREIRVKLVWDTILNLRYNDATKVMVQTVLAAQESEEVATERLIEFINLFHPGFMKLYRRHK